VPQVWGRDDDGGGLTFKQQDVDTVIRAADHRGPAAKIYPMLAIHGQSILSLCVSDLNKVSEVGYILKLSIEGF
jgi:hypothetical protein